MNIPPEPASVPPPSSAPPPVRPKAGKPRVSFNDSPAAPATLAFTSTDTVIPTSAAMTKSPSTSSTTGKGSPPKSSLKPGTATPIAAPPHTYTHADPLLRRLRLRSPDGELVDLAREFRDTEVVGFLFGAQWSRNDRQFYQDFTNLCRLQPHRFKGIYVSVDTTETAYISSARNHLWLAMEWNDGSNLPSSSHESIPAEEEIALHNGESFLLASEPDLEYQLSLNPGTPKDAYLRPYSRVHLAAKWDVLAVPGVVIYHVPSGKVVQTWVASRDLREDKLQKSFDAWKDGKAVGNLAFGEFVREYRWSVIFCVLAIIYSVHVRLFAGDNFLASGLVGFTEKFMNR